MRWLSSLSIIKKMQGIEVKLLRDLKRGGAAQQYDDWLKKKVEQSRASAEAGNLIPASDVKARFAARRAATRVRMFAPE